MAWMCQNGSARPSAIAAEYNNLKVELRDENHNVIASWDSGEQTTTMNGVNGTSWVQLAHTFSDYGPGVRYIYWEDGGRSASIKSA